MIHMRGTGVSGGLAEGVLHFLPRRDAAIEKTSAAGAGAEFARFREEQRRVVARLTALAEECRSRGDEAAAALTDVHALLAEDEDLVAGVADAINGEGVSAEWAVQTAGERSAALLASAETAYMQARAADVRDVTRQLLEALSGGPAEATLPEEPFILAAEDLLPGEAVRLDRTKVRGIALCGGSAVGHTAILARTWGIPAVFGLGGALRAEHAWRPAILDGDGGEMVIDPDEGARGALHQQQRRRQEQAARWELVRGLPDETRDGRRVEIGCNIGTLEDTAAVRANDGRGIGLFRTEFLCLAAGALPDDAAQYRACRDVVEAMAGRRVVIRTWDIGADKRLPGLQLPQEENPALGLRGIRLGLARPEILRTQLRALYRASAHGHIAILLPMITTVGEVRAVRRMCHQVMDELEQESVPFRADTEIGVMIETPASVFIAEELAREADFFSVGTNDLTQYLLACDRQSAHLTAFCDPYHPAVWQAVRQVTEAAHRAGIRVGVCGDLAADVKALPAFIALGVEELSVPPAAVLPLRTALRALDASACRVAFSSDEKE